MGLISLSADVAAAGDASAIAGKWRLKEIYNEDVATKWRHETFGSHPIGMMRVAKSGHFEAYVQSRAHDYPMSVWEDVAYTLAPQEVRGITYEGSYRFDGFKVFVSVVKVRQDGPVGTDAFDLSWSEGRTTIEERRIIQLTAGADGRELLKIVTPPTVNPNGSGNVIVGTVIWERITD
jgi:hypothetical protein